MNQFPTAPFDMSTVRDLRAWVIPNWINFCFVFWPVPAMALIYDQMSLNMTPAYVVNQENTC